MTRKSNIAWYVLLFSILFLLDRVTKFFMLQHGTQEIRVTPFLSFSLSINRGVTWGLFHSANTVIFVFVALLTAVVIGLLAAYSFFRWRSGFSVWGETIALAGALSNLVDRIMCGGVVDFIFFSYGRFSWPIFNVADMCIVAGIGIMLFGLYAKE